MPGRADRTPPPFHRVRVHALLVLAVVGVLAPTAQAQTLARGPAATVGPDDDLRPVLHRHAGHIFAFGAPAGWTANESASGIDLIAPDGRTGVSASFVFGEPGTRTPEEHLRQLVASPALKDMRPLSSAPTPPAPGPSDLQWQGIEVRFAASVDGQPIHVQAIAHVLQGEGQYSAMLTVAQGPLARWPWLRTWLPWIRDSISVRSPFVAGGSFLRGLPRGAPDETVHALHERAWRARGVPQALIEAARLGATLGYVRQRDPQTGQAYDMPLGAWNAGRSGFANPMRPAETLIPAQE